MRIKAKPTDCYYRSVNKGIKKQHVHNDNLCIYHTGGQIVHSSHASLLLCLLCEAGDDHRTDRELTAGLLCAALEKKSSQRQRQFACETLHTKKGKFKSGSQIAKFHFLLDASQWCAHLVTGKHTSTMTKKH